jgi:hypothetical protein
MSDEANVVCIPLSSTRPAHQPSRPRKRCNLGAAILLSAVQDYRSLNEDLHKDAERFLYPQTIESQEHYDWVVSLVDELNPAWLRDSLDRSRSKWDWQRAARIRATGRMRGPRRRRKGNEARKCS